MGYKGFGSWPSSVARFILMGFVVCFFRQPISFETFTIQRRLPFEFGVLRLSTLQETMLKTTNLIVAHKQGDPRAFEMLLEDFKGDLWGYLVNRVHGTHDAEDLYQEICMKVLKNMGTLREPSRFRSWLFAIAANAVRSFFRAKPNHVFEEERDALKLPSPNASADNNLVRKQQLVQLRRCIHALPERDREVLLLDVMAQLPQQDIAGKMDLNLNTVKTIIRRSKIKLARMMAEVAHD